MSNPKKSPKQNCGAEVFPVRIYHLPIKGDGGVLRGSDPASSISSQTLSTVQKTSLGGFLWRMFPDCSTVETVKTCEISSVRWMNSGIAYHGECWTQNTLERPKDVVVSTLSQVISPCAPLRFFLSSQQLKSLIKRFTAKSIPTPEPLLQAMQTQISSLSSMPALDGSLQQAHKLKDIETMEKHIHATPEAAPTLCVRQMTPSEYEKLQGFPVGWTLPNSIRKDGKH